MRRAFAAPKASSVVSTISTEKTASQNATSLAEDVIRALNTNSGVSVVTIPAGNFDLEWTVDGTTLYAAGVRKIILKGQGGEATRIYHSNTSPAIYFTNISRAGTKTTVSALALGLFNTDNYNYINRLTVADASLFAKNDIVNFKCANYPEFAASRVVSECFRVKDVDTTNDYIWVDGRLEFAQANGTSLYSGDLHVRKLDKGLSIDIYDIGFFADGDSSDTGISTRSHTIHYEAVTNSNFYNCYFEAPWEVSIRLVTCVDCSSYDCRFNAGLNNPTANQLTYGMQFYGACYNCWMIRGNVRGYRHAVTTDGYSAANTTTSSPHFSTVDTTPTVTVTRTSHGLTTGDYVRFAAAAASGNNITIGGEYQVTVLTSSTFTITAGTNANATGNFGSATAFTRFRENLWEQHGLPVYCGAIDSIASETKGAPWDTHEEGANIQFINCKAHNCHSADEVSQFVGSGYQVRCRRVTIRDSLVDVANYGISWKPGEQGSENWLKITNTTVQRLTYQSDSGRGVYITAGTGTLVNTPKLFIENCSFEECGVSLETDIAVLMETRNLSSLRPHRGHFDLATGAILRNINMIWDSRSAALPGASTADRTLFGIICAGTLTAENVNLTHIRGTDATKHTPDIFSLNESAKTISAITKANPASVTSTAHGYTTADQISIALVTNMVEINGGPYTITVVDANTFTLDGVDSSAFTTYSGTAGRALKISGTKTISNTGYRELDPSGLGNIPMMTTNRESHFTIDKWDTPIRRTITAPGAREVRIIIPKNTSIRGITFENTTANAVTGGIRIGTTSGGTDVVTAQAVGASAVGAIASADILKSYFSRTANTTLYVSAVTSWNNASVNLVVTVEPK